MNRNKTLGALRGFCTKPTTNNEIKPFVINRNPRNLEKLRLQRKPTGYNFERQLTEYWHRLCLSETRDGVKAKLIHNSEKVVVTASTSEWAIRKFLYNERDTLAYIVLARVFAMRCMESGITTMQSDVIYNEGTKRELFLKELLREGLSLEEPEVFDMNKKWHRVREKRPWTVME